MAKRILTRPRTPVAAHLLKQLNKPYGPTRTNLYEARKYGIEMFMPYKEYDILFDQISGTNFTQNSSITYENFSIKFNGSSDYIEIPKTYGLFDNTHSWTLFCRVYLASSASAVRRIWRPGAEREVFLEVNWGLLRARAGGNSADFNYSVGWHDIAFRWPLTSSWFSLWVNGSDRASDFRLVPPARSDVSTIGAGVYNGGASEDHFFNGLITFIGLSNRELTNEELNNIFADPYRFMKPVNDRTFLYPVAAPPTPEIETPLFFGTNF